MGYLFAIVASVGLGSAVAFSRAAYDGGTDPLSVSTVRAVFADGSKGAARLVGGNSGRYSQAAAGQTLGGAKRIRSVEVAWPSGMTTRVDVADPARPVVGKLK